MKYNTAFLHSCTLNRGQTPLFFGSTSQNQSTACSQNGNFPSKDTTPIWKWSFIVEKKLNGLKNS